MGVTYDTMKYFPADILGDGSCECQQDTVDRECEHLTYCKNWMSSYDLEVSQWNSTSNFISVLTCLVGDLEITEPPPISKYVASFYRSLSSIESQYRFKNHRSLYIYRLLRVPRWTSTLRASTMVLLPSLPLHYIYIIMFIFMVIRHVSHSGTLSSLRRNRP